MHYEERPAGDPAAKPRRPGGVIGGGIVALGLLAAKFKTILALLLGAKWLILAPKLLLSFGSIVLSLWLYATLWGWKFGLVFIALILVHEMGHYVTFRLFGAAVSLPLFIPGLGAFVSSPMTGDPARNAVAAIMGPVFGIAASAACWSYGLSSGQPFWIAAAYTGFFLNLFNLIPAFPLDGGRVAGAIDGRLWLAGAALIVAYIVWSHSFTSPFALLIVIFVVVQSVPRALAAFRGQVDPTIRIGEPGQRAVLAVAYFGLLALCAAGAAGTHIDLPR
jgi:Zn-dependent protease